MTITKNSYPCYAWRSQLNGPIYIRFIYNSTGLVEFPELTEDYTLDETELNSLLSFKLGEPSGEYMTPVDHGEITSADTDTLWGLILGKFEDFMEKVRILPDWLPLIGRNPLFAEFPTSNYRAVWQNPEDWTPRPGGPRLPECIPAQYPAIPTLRFPGISGFDQDQVSSTNLRIKMRISLNPANLDSDTNNIANDLDVGLWSFLGFGPREPSRALEFSYFLVSIDNGVSVFHRALRIRTNVNAVTAFSLAGVWAPGVDVYYDDRTLNQDVAVSTSPFSISSRTHVWSTPRYTLATFYPYVRIPLIWNYRRDQLDFRDFMGVNNSNPSTLEILERANSNWGTLEDLIKAAAANQDNSINPEIDLYINNNEKISGRILDSSTLNEMDGQISQSTERAIFVDATILFVPNF